MGLENPVHLIFIGIVALLVLGPRRLPELARALGHGLREFREAMSMDSREHAQPPVVQAPVAPAAVVPTAGVQPAEQQPAAPSPASGEARPVDPAQPIRSADAPDRSPL